jgi:hypothetical protein
MAGSIKWFTYQDDAGENSAIRLDESNTEAVNGTNQDFVPNQDLTVGVPRNIRVREVFYANAARTRTIRAVPLTLAIYAAILTGSTPTIPDPINIGETLVLIRANGERRTLPFAEDTGIDDGDDT